MKLILVIVASLDGRTTKGTQSPAAWASKEDQKFFFSLIKRHNLFLMGSQTYASARSSMKLSPKKLRIVLTRYPQNYQEHTVAGQLEFTNQPLRSLLDRLRSQGYKQAFLFSGEALSTIFFENRLVDEIWVTIEPNIFGLGKGIISNQELSIDLKLKSVKRLNNQGALLLKYSVD